MENKIVLGIIGGSGVYDIDGLTNTRWQKIESSFGKPSDELLFGELAGQQMVFLPRHGRGHRIPPSEINFRANIDALKRAGVTDVISVSAVGSLKTELKPGMFVIVDQFIDRTFARNKSFFGSGLVAHVSMAHPVCNRLGEHLELAAKNSGIEAVRGGTYLVMEGPQFSSVAESELYRSWGCDVIGMTNMPEAKLAREAQMCYATVAMVTDYDSWHPDHDSVTIDMIIGNLVANVSISKEIVKSAISMKSLLENKCSCGTALSSAIITDKEAIPEATKEKLSLLISKYM